MLNWIDQIKLFCTYNSLERYEVSIRLLFIQETVKFMGREPSIRDTLSSNFSWIRSGQGVDFWVKIDLNYKLNQYQRKFFESILFPQPTEELVVFKLEV